MKNVILAAGFSLACAWPAAAADEIVPLNWEGMYAGLSIGGAFGAHDTRFLKDIGLLPAHTGIFDDQSGVVGGGHAGFNRQFGAWILGIEGNLLGTSIEGSGSRRSQIAPSWTVHTDVSVHWLATGVARVGYAWGNALLFAKGGAALMYFEMDGYTTNNGIRSGSDPSSDFSLGWTAGVGAEWALTDTLSMRFDYDYLDFEISHRESGGADVKISAHQHVARVGANIALDWFR